LDTSTEGAESRLSQEGVAKKRFLEDKVKIPEGVRVVINPPASISVSGPLGNIEKDFGHAGSELSLEGDEIRIRIYGRSRKAVARLGTIKKHIKNMVTGVTQGYTYKMRIVQSHFPMSVKVQGNRLIIENFTGERHPRFIELPDKVRVEVKGDDVVIKGIDKDLVGLAAGLIETGTRIRNKDLRKFLDGIYLYEKKVGMDH
jgi:large subunit ribosomal protein L6